MSDKVQKSVRVTPDVAEYIESYSEERDVREADAMRQLLRDGVRYQQEVSDITHRLRQIEQRLGNLEAHTEDIAEQNGGGGLFG